jgi:hypothetical protein
MENELINYLYSHIEWEHIEMDMKEKYNTDKLENLSKEQLLNLNNIEMNDRLFYNHFTGELITNFMFVKISSVDNAILKDATCSIIKDKDIEYTYLNPLNIDVIFKTTKELEKEEVFLMFNKKDI